VLEALEAPKRGPKFSVVAIAKTDNELIPLRQALSQQTFEDYEFVTSTKGNIPEAWNDALSRARGEFYIFMESDALPLDETWLEAVSKFAKKGVVLKGLEVRPFDLNMSNLICDSEILKNQNFDERLSSGEDTEMFARLRSLGVPIGIVRAAPVIHLPSETWGKTLRRAFRNGMVFSLIVYKYGRKNLDSVNSKYGAQDRINPISNRLRLIAENALVLIGLVCGSVAYLPVFLARSKRSSNRIHSKAKQSIGQPSQK
jgi:GT2 family glycosyltransferase